MVKLRTLIVDDEYPARKELRYLLEKHENLKVVGEATNALEALELINNMEYSIVFLDIDMPGGSGLELGEKLKALPNPPYVVFVTAYENYALGAFAVNAVDYLLKPVDPKRLDETMNKILRLINSANSPTQPAATPAPNEIPGLKNGATGPQRLDLIPVDKRGKTILIEEKDIIYAFTDNDYVYVKTYQDKYLTRFTLKELEMRLNPQNFFRSHRCYLVNIRKTKEVIPFFNGTFTLIVDDYEKSEVPVSRAQSKKLRELLGI